MPTVVILDEDKIEVYEVPKHVLQEIPDYLFDPDEAEEAANVVRNKGALVDIIRPDYTIDLRPSD
ncbi:hypothetical protein DRO54_06215 [Candidatus Bathyarchaeota archaeon]|nr:MAG: hypothetical protein DRO54_06215 [Candidatus Bathyarchaeota archaeon]